MQAKALFDFESGGPGELSFYTDELLTIVRQVRSLHYILNLFCDNRVCAYQSPV